MHEVSAHVVIVGAGHAGGSVAALLRQYGWKAPITLIGAYYFLRAGLSLDEISSVERDDPDDSSLPASGV